MPALPGKSPQAAKDFILNGETSFGSDKEMPANAFPRRIDHQAINGRLAGSGCELTALRVYHGTKA